MIRTLGNRPGRRSSCRAPDLEAARSKGNLQMNTSHVMASHHPEEIVKNTKYSPTPKHTKAPMSNDERFGSTDKCSCFMAGPSIWQGVSRVGFILGFPLRGRQDARRPSPSEHGYMT